jgi:Mrp family chromosome partitioning ATPase
MSSSHTSGLETASQSARRAGATENAAAQQSLQQLNSVGARIVGAVLNDPDAQVPKYGAYYKYDYSTADT